MLQLPGYSLLGLLQSSSSSLLYRAVREADRQPVILKTPRSEYPGAREHARLQREYSLLRRLKGAPGVLQAHALEVLLDRPVLVLEDVGSRALSEELDGPFGLERFLPLALVLCTTLAEVHRRGVIHKDIKPANILLSPEGQPWLIDFGIATLQQAEHVEASPPQLVEGTLAYMSPEQTGRMNRTLDYRTDFYSLGVTFYQLLTGRLPLQGRDTLEWFHAHLAQAPVPPHRVEPTVPPMLSVLVMKLLSKVAEERYQGAEGLRFDLERILNGERDFPLGQKDVPARFQLPQRLYGRESEVAALRSAFERVAAGGGLEWVLVRGYSGIGKSSVVNELHQPVLRRRGFFLQGKFDQFQRDVPYATLVHALRGLVQQVLAGSDAEVAAWRQRLLDALEGQGQVMVELVPQLALILGEQPAAVELPPMETQNRFLQLFLRLMGVFATREHPLVLFLDDLQWADLASLKLLGHLTSRQELPWLLLVGAYRDNEVTAAHPLGSLLEQARASGVRLADIQLQPLSLEQTRHLVADTLPGADARVVEPLAALAQEKTAGNLFFLIQLLQTLHQERLVFRAPGGGWRWDEEGVKARGYSDNVVDFMAGRLRQLPEDTRRLLQLASYGGNVIPLSLLGILSQRDAEEVERGLEPALMEGLVVRSGPQHLRFPHDRIQQAAHDLIPTGERDALHLRVGRLLLDNLSPEELAERLFEVVGHLNAGVAGMDDAAERLRLAHLNAEAGFRARSSTAHQSASDYFAMAFSLLPGDPWEAEPSFAFNVRLAQASSEVMRGNLSESLELVMEALPRARTRVEMVKAYILKSELLRTSQSARVSVECLLECLAKLGVSLPLTPSPRELEEMEAEVWALLAQHPVESLLALPAMTDPDMKVLLSVLSSLAPMAFPISFGFAALVSGRMVALSIRHGNAEGSAVGYVSFALWYGGTRGRYREAYAIGRLAVDLAERQGLSASKSMILTVFASINSWIRPLSDTRKIMLSTYHHAQMTGEYSVACYSCFTLVLNAIISGRELSEVHREAESFLSFTRKYSLMHDIILYLQRIVQQLRGLSRTFQSPSGDGIEEEALKARIEKGGEGFFYSVWSSIMRMQSAYLSGDLERALRLRAQVDPLMAYTPLEASHIPFNLYGALALAASHRRTPEPERPAVLEEMRKHQRRLATSAENCPANFLAPERLVSAELARLEERPQEALRAYEGAIQAARIHDSLPNVGLASEQAARFCEEQGLHTLATAFIRQAREAYVQWGAMGKVRQLDEQWPILLTSVSATQGSTTRDSDNHGVDALAVVRAQQAISSEIVLERLVDTLMRVAVESSGAQRGALLLLQDDVLQFVAGVPPLSTEEAGAPPSPERLPLSLVAYARRTGEYVLLDDLAQPHPFSADPYFATSDARSLLCLPLRRKETFFGLLYLENALTTQAFSHARIALLTHLASQASISIENARLYAEVRKAGAALRQANEELEARVRERTQELKQAQAQLVETARMVGMAEVASNVLHDVGNVLNSIVVDTQLMRGAVSSSRMRRLQQVASLLEEKRPALADFFTRDTRGRHLVDYLRALADTLAEEHSTLSRSLETLDGNVSRVRAIVQNQQTHATSALLLEECDLPALVAEALRLQEGVLRRAGITVSRELSPLPPVRADKHQVLKILLNLLSNARQAMEFQPPERPRRLVIRLSAEGGWVSLQVVDTGKGIASEVRPRLFTQGFTTREGGHGIGLHSSALAARLMHAHLSLDSGGPGTGATATLLLPLAPVPSGEGRAEGC
ncbi:trifunctional serine/threonine-protein kinase/ATP-binding protein/sensor histidine kinase [Cystobacter ferrugineus]|uniref:Histidine kinase n=1 Tax=Cystobacter ferrugineus TaxID=83449 RepID=A0A1L9B7A3_9BACT|nr:ATP-binding sensor histidine kinase [Cystobacter ferrugineus]OJH38128.1 histidine kinase [Cystobacter ferrugineus]